MAWSRLPPFRSGFLTALAWVPLLVFCFSCGKADSRPARAGNPPSQDAGPLTGSPAGPPPSLPAGTDGRTAGSLPAFLPPETLIALLRPAEIPLWFEVSAAGVLDAGGPPAGPRHIRSPAEAGLAPFTPWPLAPHVAAALTAGEALYLAVNRGSLLVIVPTEGGDLGLYRFDATAYWESYTVGNLFLYDDTPALFFYRDDNFAEPAAAPPDPPVLGLASPRSGGQAALVPLAVPVLAELAEGWEADILRQGPDSLWYYRELRRVNGGREFRYFRSPALSLPGEKIGVGAYRSAWAPGGSSAETPGGPAGELPPLPENFVYTHVNRLGDFVFAAWEEQEDYSIGAAGFMVVRSR